MSEWVRRHRRNIGIPFLFVALLLAHYENRYLLLSVFLVAIGEFLRILSSGHLQKEKVFTTGGPYRRIRNPLYLGSFLIAVGFCLISGSPWIWLLVFAYFGFCYLPVIRYEEKVLAQKFPEEYPPYVSIIPAFYPSWKPYPVSTTRFSWHQVVANKEYNALLGIVIVYVYLLLLRA